MNSERKTVSTILGILILTGSSGIPFGAMFQDANAETSKRIVGYFPWWESGDIDSIDYSKVTDINYFHIWPNEDGSLDTTDINYDIGNLHTIRDRAHASGVNVLISVGGWGVSDAFSTMAENPVSRANFVTNIQDFIFTHNLDGVDIDWEPVDTEAKKDNLALLLSDLSGALKPNGKLVTVAVNAERVELRESTIDSLSWVNIMAYDMNWDNAEHSTFDDAVAALQRYESNGFPKGKLVLGIPFYGRTDSWSSEMKYEDLVATCSPGPEENYCNGYFFNGIDLVQQKSQHVLNGGYYGVMVWNLGQDTYDQTSLLNAINAALSGESIPPNMAHLENLEITKSGNKRWSATSTITVFNENEVPVSGATVNGLWSGGASNSATCVTDSEGKCQVIQSTKADSLTFSVDSISGYNVVYDSLANEVENSITINRDQNTPAQNLPPIADAGGPYSGTINQPIIFDGSGSNDPEGGTLAYSWSFGDGFSSNEPNPSHTYSVEGSYAVSLTVTDIEGGTDSDSTLVQISATSENNLSISQILPDTMVRGETSLLTITGTGFDQNATIEFSGDKWSPSVIQITVFDSQSLEIEVTRSTAGPSKIFVYDVTVINPNGDSFTLPDSFTVLP